MVFTTISAYPSHRETAPVEIQGHPGHSLVARAKLISLEGLRLHMAV
jgi:hypothetical protein